MELRRKIERIDGETDELLLHKVGCGNWRAMLLTGYPLDRILDAAENWKTQVQGIEKPWLVWCAHPDWAVLQQKIVKAGGWTPIVGNDPRVSDVPVLPGSVYINFNKGLDLPLMYPHFPVELVFKWIDKLAFWHSDLLLTPKQIHRFARQFEKLEDGACIATRPGSSFHARLKQSLKGDKGRYWELLGCTTKGASQDQWNKGSGWWYNFHLHVNCPSDDEFNARKDWYFDHGTGVKYWHKKLGGKVHLIPEHLLERGHFSKIGKPDFIRSMENGKFNSMRSMETDMARNFELVSAAKSMQLDHLLES